MSAGALFVDNFSDSDEDDELGQDKTTSGQVVV